MPLDSNRPPHQHNEESSFDAMLEEAKRTGIGSKSDESPTASLSSDEQLTDNFQPEEEKDRSRSISVILRYYGESYGNKVAFQRKYRKILFWGCSRPPLTVRESMWQRTPLPPPGPLHTLRCGRFSCRTSRCNSVFPKGFRYTKPPPRRCRVGGWFPSS